MIEQVDLKSCFEWDVESWSRAVHVWRTGLERLPSSATGLDIGGRNGGLTLFLVKEKGISMVCSDLSNPKDHAIKLHKQKNITDKVAYAAVDCTNISYEDNTFDIVVFKSVIGALGDFNRQQQAINEMHRVLKPGGVLLFAENQEATKLHMFLRKKLVRWSSYWRYLKSRDMATFLSPFSHKEIRTTGFFAVFAPEGTLRKMAAIVDRMICKVIPGSFHYITYGYAVKSLAGFLTILHIAL